MSFLKVGKSRKRLMTSSNLPKNERKKFDLISFGFFGELRRPKIAIEIYWPLTKICYLCWYLTHRFGRVEYWIFVVFSSGRPNRWPTKEFIWKNHNLILKQYYKDISMYSFDNLSSELCCKLIEHRSTGIKFYD